MTKSLWLSTGCGKSLDRRDHPGTVNEDVYSVPGDVYVIVSSSGWSSEVDLNRFGP